MGSCLAKPESMPTVQVERLFFNRDLYNMVVRCPYCAQEHVHGPVYCVKDKAELKEPYTSQANCGRGKYIVNRACVEIPARQVSKARDERGMRQMWIERRVL